MTAEYNKGQVAPKQKDIRDSKTISSEPDVIRKLREIGFKFGTIDRQSGKPEDRNLI